MEEEEEEEEGRWRRSEEEEEEGGKGRGVIGSTSPLSGRAIHNDVDPEDLHGIEGVGQSHYSGQRDQSQGRNAPVMAGRGRRM